MLRSSSRMGSLFTWVMAGSSRSSPATPYLWQSLPLGLVKWSSIVSASAAASGAWNAMPQLVQVVETRSSSRASHLPVLHPEHLSSSATPFNAESMCRPQPAQVNRLAKFRMIFLWSLVYVGGLATQFASGSPVAHLSSAVLRIEEPCRHQFPPLQERHARRREAGIRAPRLAATPFAPASAECLLVGPLDR